MKTFNALLFFLLISLSNLHATCEYHQTIRVEELAIGAMLHWTTASENDNAMFKVEKSTDGIQFVEIGIIQAVGNSEKQNTYSFLDINCRQKKNFYRLKQIDFNGVYSYSSVSAFQLNHPNQLTIVNMSPVVAPDLFEFSIDALTTGNLQYHLEDWKGNTLHVAKSNITIGLNKIQVKLTKLPLGIYRVVLNFGEEQETLTIKKIAAAKNKKK